MVIRGAWAWIVIVVLVLSVALNFFIAGFLFERGRQFFAGGGNPMVGRMLADFPPEVRRSIGRELWSERGDFEPIAREIRSRREAFLEVVRAPVLDEARLIALLGEMRGDLDRLQVRSQAAILASLKRMTPEDRARIGTGEGRGWGGGGWGGHGGWGGGPPHGGGPGWR